MNPNVLLVVRHCFGCCTVAGIYTAQVIHVKEFFKLNAGSIVYLFAVLAFYIILYGYDAKLIRFHSARKERQLHYFKATLLIFNLALSFLEYWYNKDDQKTGLPIILFQGLFSFFCVLFAEKLVPLMLEIEINTGKKKPE